MSIKLMSEVWTLNLSHPNQAVLLALADHADDQGWNCYPSIGYVAWKTGYSERHTKRILHQLEKDCLITIYQDRGRGNTNSYHIHLEGGQRKEPYVPIRYIPEALRGEIIEALGYVCQYCEQPGSEESGPDGQPWHIDRILSAAEGGRYTPDNVTLSCGTCNRSKKDAVKGANTTPFTADDAGITWDENVPSDTEKVPSSTQKRAIVMAPEPSRTIIEPSLNHQRGANAPPADPIQAKQKSFPEMQPPKREKPKRRKGRDTRTDHPAVQAVKEVRGTYPPKVAYDQVINALGDVPDVARLANCYERWCICGYNANSLIWAVEWYATGIPPHGQEGGPARANGNGKRPPKAFEGIIEACQEEGIDLGDFMREFINPDGPPEETTWDIEGRVIR